MKMARSKYVLAFVFFVTFGMIVGSLFQLAFIWQLEESSGTSHWENDKETILVHHGSVRPEILSWSPRIILFHNFLSMQECDYLKAIGRPRLAVSMVIDDKTGKGIKSKVRTSSGMFLTSEEQNLPIIQAIENRIAVFSQIPAENGEQMQVLRYKQSQFYSVHSDYFTNITHIKKGGQRVATMLMYLNDDVEGGETYFPMAAAGECSCGGTMVRGLCVKPSQGDALLFWSLGLNGRLDPHSLHAGCPVLSGEKWSATKWMRESTLR
ncbi:prolyl 4-hydroxylase 1-like [Musa acuminata AAA Group]|uniref:prolyl 4-hydroxylase 1-like n=1 Tax=Musa acuminata AAA Group TaxID=214697 RepID=UPI0031D07E03